MMYKFKSEEAMNQFVSEMPCTDQHNLLLAGIVGLDPFRVHDEPAYKDLGGFWVSKGGQDFFITDYEKQFLVRV
ncbi:hypothetical protein [Aeromonas phage AS-yj]|uniref:Uncharacterized protein n=5 Tax=Caudoviricetes TaxID=2731619 RepID=A0A291LE04_9CAUD|nr:goF mRNA metabolism modulator [Aeromonas phage AS-zj]YP_009835060.1 goF mRNA metabolism modulator [Aeromonas phage AS-sw]ATI17570.1 hypothetical protein [Aeromonas phage AS-szw]ATI17938.1 hypothetical protein [Aeromonas phage AS-yj]QAX98946.1 hypothetical protein assk_154 [Aeromonas phage Assk]UKM62637.1 hypothetical protein P19_0149 [Aeromonas phage P19]ASU00426.1 hypothetical protein [Aeromonas phage AS-zj]